MPLDLSDDRLLEVIHRAHERRDVDFKRSMPWSDETKLGLIKDIIAFSNSGGGLIVVGYDEGVEDTANRATGITDEDSRTWEITKVSQALNKYASPPIDIGLRCLPDAHSGVRFLVLEIPTHRNVPHVCVKDRDVGNTKQLRGGAIYIRTASKSCEEIVALTDWQELIRRCLLNDRRELFDQFETLLKGHSAKLETPLRKASDALADMDQFRERLTALHPDPVAVQPANSEGDVGGSQETRQVQAVSREVLFRPVSDWQSHDILEVRRALGEACVDYRGWPYLFFFPNSGRVRPEYDDNCIWAFDDEPFNGRARLEYWNFDHSRGLLYTHYLTDESSLGYPRVLDPFFQVRLLAEAHLAAARLYLALGYGESTLCEVVIRYSPMRGVQARSFDRAILRAPFSREFGGGMLTRSTERELAMMVGQAPQSSAEDVRALLLKMGIDRGPSTQQLAAEAAKHIANERRLPAGM